VPFVSPAPRAIEHLIDIDHASLASLPVMLPSDVVRFCTIQRAKKETALCARAAACAALAAGAHAGPYAMSRMLIEIHWRPEGKDVVIIPDKIERPMPLLPFVRHAVEAYLKLRGNPTAGPLLVTADGKPAQAQGLLQGLGATARLFGMKGNNIFDKLHAFFERQLDAEPDRIAVDYMTGRFTYFSKDSGRKSGVPERFPEIHDLKNLLQARHALAGPALTYFGPSSAFLEDEDGNLPERVHRRKFSEAMKTDPTVRELAAIEWPAEKGARRKLRRDLKRRHLAHLHALWKADRLTLVEIAWLWRLPAGHMTAWKSIRYFIPTEVPTIKRKPEVLRPMLVEFWRARPAGEKLFDFAWRMVGEIGLPSIRLAGTQLRGAGEIGRRRRGRPRKNRRGG
jgi:hypothetical protein